MASETVSEELQDFVQYATRRIARGKAAESVEELVHSWRRAAEFQAAVADVQAGLIDDRADLAEPLADVLAELRKKL